VQIIQKGLNKQPLHRVFYIQEFLLV
jgi:hypothetical protein